VLASLAGGSRIIEGMRKWLCSVLLVAACTDPSTSKPDASRLFVATTDAVVAAQAKAVTATQQLTAPAVRNLDYIGPCSAEGSSEVRGTYDDSGNAAASTFELQVTFMNCVDVTGNALDGSLHWSSSASASGFDATLSGSIDWSDHMNQASCDLDLHMAVTSSTILYAGTVCGYDVQTDLHL
jgi:hypothetical protein